MRVSGEGVVWSHRAIVAVSSEKEEEVGMLWTGSFCPVRANALTGQTAIQGTFPAV